MRFKEEVKPRFLLLDLAKNIYFEIICEPKTFLSIFFVGQILANYFSKKMKKSKHGFAFLAFHRVSNRSEKTQSRVLGKLETPK